ncbi:MAG: phage tail tube protein, partial [Planctomycetia bacterium]
SDASCTVGGQPIELRGFRLTLDNKLQVNRAAGYGPAHLTHGVREVGLTLAVYKTAATYDALRRSAALATTAVQLTLKGRHLGTAADAFTRVVLTLPAARLADATDAERQRLDDLVRQDVSYIALKPNEAADLTAAFDTTD